jgi:hypothetical protein
VSRRIAFLGIFTGISVVMLYMSAIMPTGKLTLYFLASLPVAFSIIEAGTGAGISLFFASCILSALISGNILGIVPYAFFFGHYPVFKYLIEKGRKAVAEVILKLTVFNLSMLLWYLLFKSIFLNVLPVQITDNPVVKAVFIVGMQLLFFIYDYAFSKLIFYYESKLGQFRKG